MRLRARSYWRASGLGDVASCGLAALVGQARPQLVLRVMAVTAVLTGSLVLGGLGTAFGQEAMQLTVLGMVGLAAFALTVERPAAVTTALVLVMPWVENAPATSFLGGVRIGVEVFLLPAIVLLGVHKRVRRPQPWIVWPWSVVLLVVALEFAVARSGDPVQMLLKSYYRYLVPILTVVAIGQFLTSRRDIDRLLRLLVPVGLGLEAAGLFEFVTKRSLFTSTGELLWQDAGGRVAGPLLNPAAYAVVLTILGLYSLARLPARRGLDRIASQVFIVGLMPLVALTLMRSGWFALAAGAGCYALLSGKARVPILAVLGVGLALSVALWPQIEHSSLYSQRIDPSNQLPYRLENFAAGIHMYRAEPLIGYGFGSYYVQSLDFLPLNSGLESENGRVTSHNSFITILAEQGLSGAVPTALTLALAARQLLLAYKRRRGLQQEFVAASLASIPAYLVTAFWIELTIFPVTLALTAGLAQAALNWGDGSTEEHLIDAAHHQVAGRAGDLAG